MLRVPKARKSLSLIDSRKKLGNQAEQYVASHLKKQGYKILERNYRQRFGEIDIITQKGECIAFIEVKARKNDYFNLSQVVSYSKQQKIIKTARYYCAQKQIIEKVLRFDIALVLIEEGAFDLTYIKNAFV